MPPSPLPTSTQTAQGALICAQNAGDLLRAARVLGRSKLYGPAISLLVLAVEEATKARALIDGFSNDVYGLDKDEVRAIISRGGDAHRARHLAAGFDIILPPLMRRLMDRTKSRSQRQPAKLAAASAAFMWYFRANALKQRGLYVDFQANMWHSPRELTVDDFRDGLAHVDRFVKRTIKDLSP